MTTWLIIAIVVFVTVLDIVILVSIIHWGWRSLPRAFPATEPGPDAVWRRYQSFRLGVMNLGFCIHVAADERHLHLVPIKLIRAIGGRPASIPWESIKVEKVSRNGRWITARVGTHMLVGPAWCMELAEPAGNESCRNRS